MPILTFAPVPVGWRTVYLDRSPSERAKVTTETMILTVIGNARLFCSDLLGLEQIWIHKGKLLGHRGRHPVGVPLNDQEKIAVAHGAFWMLATTEKLAPPMVAPKASGSEPQENAPEAKDCSLSAEGLEASARAPGTSSTTNGKAAIQFPSGSGSVASPLDRNVSISQRERTLLGPFLDP